MTPSLGMLVEIRKIEDENKTDKMAIIKIDQVDKKIVLENRLTKEKVEMTFSYFEEVTGLELDKRTLLKG